MIKKACGMALEGVVSKRSDAPYVSRRDKTWLKSKCSQRQEFVVIGYTEPRGARSGFGSLLLGYHGANKELIYAGRVGAGFDERMLIQTLEQLRKLKQNEPPTASPPPARERHNAHWVKPTLVAEVRFTGWTRGGLLRHPVFVAFRSDKPASQIVRELPVKAEKVQLMHAPSRRKITPGRRQQAGPHSKAGNQSIAGVILSHPDKIFILTPASPSMIWHNIIPTFSGGCCLM